jgi:hypothetical protein
MSDPIAVFDPSLATASERAILMCIKRIDELECRLQDAERRLQDADRNTAVHLLTVTGEDCFSVYVETMCFILGASPIEHRSRLEPIREVTLKLRHVIEWAQSVGHDSVALKRAEQLHHACFFSMNTQTQQQPHPQPPLWSRMWLLSSPEFPRVAFQNMCERMNTVKMLRLLSADEAARLWEWRLIKAGWICP